MRRGADHTRHVQQSRQREAQQAAQCASGSRDPAACLLRGHTQEIRPALVLGRLNLPKAHMGPLGPDPFRACIHVRGIGHEGGRFATLGGASLRGEPVAHRGTVPQGPGFRWIADRLCGRPVAEEVAVGARRNPGEGAFLMQDLARFPEVQGAGCLYVKNWYICGVNLKSDGCQDHTEL